MRMTSSATLELPEDTLVILFFPFLVYGETYTCLSIKLLASEWYSRWPLWRVVKLSSFLRTSPSYGVPSSHLFPELQISPIEVHISPIQLQISTIDLQIYCRYLQILSIWRYLQLNCRYLQFDKSNKISAPRRKNRCAMIQVSGLIKSCI